MKDKWLDDLHERMSDFEMDAPENLWSEIENSRKRTAAPLVIRRRKRFAVAAATVATIISVGIGYMLFQPKDIHPMEQKIILVKSHVTSSQPHNTTLATQVRPKPITDTSLSAKSDSNVNTTPEEKVDTPCEVYEKGITTSDTTILQSAEPTLSNPTKKTTGTPSHRTSAEHQPIIAHRHNTPDNNLTFGLYTSGGGNFNQRSRAISDGVTTATGPDNTDWEDRAKLGILLYNQGKEITTEIKHHQPIRAGFSTAYRLTDRISIGTGITYTKLSSDIKSGSETHYFSGRQTLHYIGIPVNISCDIASWRRLHLYATAGVLGEKCVSGKTVTDYVIGSKNSSTDTEKIGDKPLQFSINASAGLQFDITKAIGIYAEPGVSYYFNDGSDIRTIYKDKPLNFNLNLGLRFSFGK